MADSSLWPVAGAAVCLLAFGGYTVAQSLGADTYTCTVTEDGKDRGGREGGYRVYTQDCGVLSVEDRILRGHVTAADVWSQIESGQTHEFTVVGFRFPLLSDFPNVVAVEPATTTETTTG